MSVEDNASNLEFHEMTDEEFMAMAEPDFGSEESHDFDREDEGHTDLQDDPEEPTDLGSEDDDIVDDDNIDNDEVDSDDSDGEDDNAEEDSKDDEEKEPSDEDDAESEETSDDDAENFRKAILAPFKANGREVQVKDETEAVRLMQMGANYSKKMAGLKPVMKIARMLEDNNLLDESKLNFLIDLDKKNPDAIKQLITDSEIDLLELENVGNDTEYKPKDYSVDDRTIQLSEVIEEIQETPHYGTTVNTIKDTWDATSKELAYKDPAILKAINDQIGKGVYDKIANGIANERMFGRLVDVPYLEAYRIVGEQLQASGALGGTPSAQPQATETVTNKPKDSDLKRNSRRKAASTTKSKPAKKENTSFDPFELSDEEFLKFAEGKF